MKQSVSRSWKGRLTTLPGKERSRSSPRDCNPQKPWQQVGNATLQSSPEGYNPSHEKSLSSLGLRPPVSVVTVRVVQCTQSESESIRSICVYPSVRVDPTRSDSTRLGLVSPKVGPSYGKSVCERLKLVTRGTTSCNVCFSTNVARYCSLLNDNGVTCWMAMKAFNFCRTRIKNYFHFWRQIWKWRMTKSSCHCVLQALLALVPFKLRWIFTITCCGRPI